MAPAWSEAVSDAYHQLREWRETLSTSGLFETEVIARGGVSPEIDVALAREATPFYVYAVGDIVQDGDESPTQIGVLVDRQLLELVESAAPSPLLSRLNLDPRTTRVIDVGPPAPQYAPGDQVRCVSRKGTLGLPVVTGSGAPGIMTAGHVAPLLGLRCRVGSSDIGYVSFTSDPISSARGDPEVDVAVIHCREPAYWPQLWPVISDEMNDSNLNRMQLQKLGGPSGLRTAQVMMRSPAVFSPAMQGEWLDCLVSTRAMSVAGDSGALVVISSPEDPPNQSVVGHVVGGDGDRTTYVQSVRMQLTKAACEPASKGDEMVTPKW
jgi:hypothetical protein